MSDYCPHAMRAGASAFVLVFCAIVIAFIAVGCDLDNEGDKPPRGELYFPNAMALSQDFLFVANSNFDLRYNAGTVQAYSRVDLAAEADLCRATPDCVIPPSKVHAGEARIGSHSTSIAVSRDERQLFVTTRTDSSLTYFDLIPFESEGKLKVEMACPNGGDPCESNAGRALDPYADGDAFDWPSEPMTVVSGPLTDFSSDGVGNYALTSHRGFGGDGGALSLFVEVPGEGFTLVSVLDGLEPGLTQLAYDAESHLVHLGVARGTASGRTLARVGVTLPEGEFSPLRAQLFNARSILLEGATDVAETHDLAFSPKGLLAVSQSPSALLAVDLPPAQADGESERARVTDTVVVGTGASRVVAGTVDGRALAIVTCFNAREIFVIDLDTMQARSVVPNLSGPFEVALDEERSLLYVADYRTSVIRIVDLLPLLTGDGDGTAAVIATVGKPKIVQELQ